ncbi:hypothetical protein LCGC14_0017190 [marine sediment metagenome]|uniref:TubC N-terminal docking domain-containing protein n=1 Tax=marine sediment metagenome TaxID=412755 RepID=A0A0F9WFG9_9ZZZZ
MKPSSQQALALLADLATVGISVRVDGKMLRVGPRAKVTPTVAQRVRDLKSEVLAVLRSRPSEVTGIAARAVGGQTHYRFAVTQTELRRRGFHVLADKPEFVLAVLAAVNALLPKLATCSNNDGINVRRTSLPGDEES